MIIQKILKIVVILILIQVVLMKNALASISRYIQPPFYDNQNSYPVTKQYFGNRIYPLSTTNSNKIFTKKNGATTTTLSPRPPMRKLEAPVYRRTTEFQYNTNYNYQTPAAFTPPIPLLNNITQAIKWYPDNNSIKPEILHKSEAQNPNYIKDDTEIIISSSIKPPHIKYLPSKESWDENGQVYPAIIQSIDLSILNNSFQRARSPGEQFELDLKQNQLKAYDLF